MSKITKRRVAFLRDMVRRSGEITEAEIKTGLELGVLKYNPKSCPAYIS